MATSRQIASTDINPFGFIVFAKSAVQVSLTGNTNETTLATITLPGGTIGPNGIIRVRADFSLTNSANNKTLRIRLGGASGTIIGSFVPTTVPAVQMDYLCSNRNSASSQYSNGFNTRGTDQLLSSNASATASINTASSQDVVITGQLASGAETVTLERYFLEVLYGA